MKRTILGIVVGGLVVWGASSAYDFWQYVFLSSQPPANWLRIDEFVVAGGEKPVVHVRYQVLKPVTVRTNISPRNVETGTSICSGRTATVIYEPGDEIEADVPVAALAGLKNCDWPPGRYVASVTLSMTDAATNTALNPMPIETNEFVVPEPQ